MVLRLFSFTLMNIIIWIIPIFDKTYIMINGKSFYWLHAIHHYMISFNGTGNAILWSQSSNWKSFKSSYKTLNSIDPDNDNNNKYIQLDDNMFAM